MSERPAATRLGRLGALVFVVLALTGTLLGHALVWSLVGGASPGLATARSIHNYLRPLGAALVVVAMATSWAVWKSLALLRSTADRLRRAFWRRALWRDPRDVPVDGQPGTPTTLGITWWSALLAVQLCVYAVQENLEARAAHVPMPGVGVLTAQHGAPIALHAMVALGLAALATMVSELFARRRRDVEQIVRLIRALAVRRRSNGTHALPGSPAVTTPRGRFGLSFISRPPPLVAG